MHLASSGRVIIRLKVPLDEGRIVCDNTGRKVAKVTEMIGPVSKPYASAISLTNNIQKYIDQKVYSLDEPVIKRDKFRKRKR